MNKRTNMSPLRGGVILTLLSLVGVVVIFELATRSEWNLTLIITQVVLLLVLLVSFIISFGRTGLWRFSHKPINMLDEREMEMTGRSLRIAYALFTIFVLCLLLTFAILNISVSIVLAVSLILFAHLLPGAVMAFGERVLYL